MVLILGGSFDPVHLGHLDLIKQSFTRYQPKALLLVPAKKNPLKQLEPGAGAVDRMQMVRLATSGLNNPKILPIDWELDRAGPSYTWDTVQAAKASTLDNQIVLVLGDEVFSTFSLWHRSQELLQTVDIVVCSRSSVQTKVHLEREIAQCGIFDGVWTPSSYQNEIKLTHSHGRRWIETLSIDALPISGSEIREVLSIYRGSVRPPGIPNSVWDYIKKRNLYTVK
jgi:nicotinate-nucleotide adenylyltransferase